MYLAKLTATQWHLNGNPRLVTFVGDLGDFQYMAYDGSPCIAGLVEQVREELDKTQRCYPHKDNNDHSGIYFVEPEFLGNIPQARRGPRQIVDAHATVIYRRRLTRLASFCERVQESLYADIVAEDNHMVIAASIYGALKRLFESKNRVKVTSDSKILQNCVSWSDM